MKIAYVGNFSQPFCTEVHIAATLQDLGHSVERLQENELQPWWASDMVAAGADLVLYTRTWGQYVTLEHLAQLREGGITTASYHLDLYVGLKREDGLDDDPFWRTDFVFTPDGDPASAEVFERKGINHHYIKPGVFKGECYINAKEESRFALGNDVVFVGGGSPTGEGPQYGHEEWPYRGELLKFLKDTYGDRFSKYGYPQETIRNDRLNQLYANSKVVVGDSLCLGFSHPYYWSDRVYETLGRGGFIIHPFIPGMDEEFTDGENIVFYDFADWDQLKQKIDYWLANDAERELVRRNGHEFVKNNATYHDRLTQALDIIASAGDAYDPSPALPIKINLGAGSEPTEGWVNVDWILQDGINVVHNLLDFPWPFSDESADEIKAIDVLEHMPLFNSGNESTPIKFIEECWRILTPGGKLFITVPHWQSPNLWIDPTHVRGYDEKSFDYFDPTTDLGKWFGYYSPCKFHVSAVRTPNDNVEYTMIKRAS